MTRTDNVLTGLFALNDAKLTPSQRKKCLTLYAMQDNPYGMISQWLYSRALERENSHYQTISVQQQEIDQVNAFKESLLSEIEKMKELVHQREQQTTTLEHVLFDELSKLKSGVKEITSGDRKLLNDIHKLENHNKLLHETLYQAMIEIQKLITSSN